VTQATPTVTQFVARRREPRSPRWRLRGFLWSALRPTLYRLSLRGWYRWRRSLLRLAGADVHRSARIAASVRIKCPWNLRVGPGVHIDRKVILDCTGTITIGEATRISPFAHLCAVTYDYTSVQMPVVTAPITIGRDVWIANDAFVGPGVTVGDGAVLAARSSAFSDLPTGQVCMGEPARPRHPRQ
jgi:putative colanic acid biosynthesis acetyltransferase WcaF